MLARHQQSFERTRRKLRFAHAYFGSRQPPHIVDAVCSGLGLDAIECRFLRVRPGNDHGSGFEQRKIEASRIAWYSAYPACIQLSSTLPGGASKPVCKMALLALLAPESRSAPRSRRTTFAPRERNVSPSRSRRHPRLRSRHLRSTYCCSPLPFGVFLIVSIVAETKRPRAVNSRPSLHEFKRLRRQRARPQRSQPAASQSRLRSEAP